MSARKVLENEMTDFNKLLAADELLHDIKANEKSEQTLFSSIPIEVREDVPLHTLYLINGKDYAMVKDIKQENWGFIEFVQHSAEFMLGSVNPVWFYLYLPIAWIKFDRLQRRG